MDNNEKRDFKDPKFIKNLIATLEDQIGLDIVDCDEIAPGLVVALCRAGTYNIYFDKSRWSYEEIKIRNVEGTSIGMVPGYKKGVELKDFTEARMFAKQHLKQKPGPK